MRVSRERTIACPNMSSATVNHIHNRTSKWCQPGACDVAHFVLNRRAAMGLVWLNIVAVPIGAIVLFRMVHVLPERFAPRCHRPQHDANRVALGGGFGPPALEAVATR